jgi:hypothetical protein
MENFDFLTNIEKEKVEAFCKDKVMHEAVRKVLLRGIYTHGTVKEDFVADPLVNGAFSLVSLAMTNPIPDEQLGTHLRGMWTGINAMKNAFDGLGNVRVDKKKKLLEKEVDGI